MLSNTVVEVFGPEQVTLPRTDLTGITPGGEREIDFWSGNASISLSFQAGNTRHDITRRLKFTENINFVLTKEEAGLYATTRCPPWNSKSNAI